MGIDRIRTDAGLPNPTWDEIVESVELLAEKAKSGMPSGEFHAIVIEKVLAATGCECGKIWTKQNDESPHSVHPPTSRNHGNWSVSASVCRAGVAEVDTADDAFPDEVCDSNQTQRLSQSGRNFWRTPVRVDGDPVAVIQLVGATDSTADQRHGTEQLLSVVGDLIAEHARAEQFRLLKARERYRGELDRFVLKVHESLDADQIAYLVVNLGRTLINADRLTLLLADKKRMRVSAVSGVDTVDHRSQSIMEIERQATDARGASQNVWTDKNHLLIGESAQILSVADGNQSLVAPVPAHVLHSPLKLSGSGESSVRHTIGMLRIEWFEPLDKTQKSISEARVQWISQHVSQAIANSITTRRRWIFGTSKSATLAPVRRKGISLAVLLLLAIVISTAFFILEAELKIEARGFLQPVTREIIFAPRAATVLDFPIIQNAVDRLDIVQVRPGDVIVQLESAELQYELTTLMGEQATIAQQLDTISITLSQLGQLRMGTAGNRERFDELTAQSLELRIRNESLTQRIMLLQNEQQKLNLTSPIAGRIVTWDFTRKLRGRPVSQGDRLLEIVDTDGPWQLELHVPDHHFGYVSEAAKTQSSPLKISFIERSNPTVQHSGEVVSIGRSTEVFSQYGASVRLIGTVEKDRLSDSVRPGTTVIAEIDCGRRSLGFVWLHDLWEAIRMNILF